MTTKTAIASFEGPRRGYIFPLEYVGEEKISEGQRRVLTELIYTYIQGESEQESRISELESLTYSEAENCILDFSFARWK
ncbi:hypothetical protein A2W67_02620 [Candidatus Nomurabacteria bacterium RIFCSPLOWO2_02_40_28]|uniref:Uncharacterized protein n=2 Tax=Candidatus Nomuraibacteriota TaxID=1752729 RepID=A0A837HTJ1_9BACT|nr:MAG: hypothetical protein UT27_C0007G0031 [Candidatus Nomurabacteria bacterium GW2011_GWD2_39_12]KKR20376.1 MAG: hypothetical protein UT51_C0004G0035 [Candidatus Nomurabacteria bacterium GW2011_GWC2_39_41]KKR37093.1 MAG: hypothetical protein UT70_C0003G0035 [Candidatus Nomurabacteria bacterium GW2011_GWE2_40_10]KKR38296.1 MAG: hypothetical protein UT73_C0004G0041 [Candidatus Nomurabacteria bacterium GW2011_GWB1_40_11]KKR39818.1 MAG: hypothetical protein UT74_C0005G0035 [Parcubacteria group b